MRARSLAFFFVVACGCSASHLALPDAAPTHDASSDAGTTDASDPLLTRDAARPDAGSRDVCTCWDADRGGPVCYPRDAAPCGADCAPCELPENAVATCDAFAFCAFECAPGFALTGAGCVPADVAPPRPLWPLSTQRLSTRRPTLRFALPPGVPGMEVDLCRDRDCAILIARERVDGDSFPVRYELAPGAWFFRAFGRIGDTVGTTPSATWEIFVPAVEGPRALAWDGTHDVDADGFDDLLVERAESIELHRGGPDGVISEPVLTLPRGQARIVGDLDGDGFADLVHWSRIGGPWLQVGYGSVRAEATALRPVVLEGASGYEERVVLPGGDLDGDGFGDLVVGCPICGGRQGQVWIHRGGRDGVSLDATTARVVTSPLGYTYNYFGTTGGAGGDLDGDGYGDFAVASSGEPGGLFVIRGRPDGPWWDVPGNIASGDPIAPDLRFDALGGGTLAAPLSDVDGDRRADVAAYFSMASAVRTWAGGTTTEALAADAPARALEPCGPDQRPIVPFAEIVGDVDGDGTLDRAFHDCIGRLTIERGGAFVVEPLTAGKRLTRLSAVGDVDADGLADLLVESAAETYARRAPILVFGARPGDPPRTQALPVE